MIKTHKILTGKYDVAAVLFSYVYVYVCSKIYLFMLLP